MIRMLAWCGRLGVTLICLGSLAAAESRPGYQWPATTLHDYTYISDLTAILRTADDELRYRTRMTWKWALYVAEVSDGVATLELRAGSILVQRTGPEGERSVRITAEEPVEDPLLVHLAAHLGVALRVRLDQASGRVLGVEGGEALVARLDALVPRAPGEAPPLHDLVVLAVAPERLQAHWEEVFRLPAAGGGRFSLPPPLELELERSWDGSHWQVRLPQPGAEVALGADPVPLRLAVTSLSGAGQIVLHPDGRLRRSEGRTGASLAGRFQGQGVALDLDIRWSMGLTEQLLSDEESEPTPTAP